MTVAKASKAKGRADKYFSLLVRARARFACENQPCPYAEKGYRLECAHVYSRSYSSTRVDFDNAFALCSACHAWFTARPVDWAEFVLSKLGRDRYEALRLRAVSGVKVDWEAEADLLKAMWDDYEKSLA